MVYQVPLPEQLADFEYVRLYFHLEITDCFDLPEFALLQLRRELLPALKSLTAQAEDPAAIWLKNLLLPPLPEDPLVLRRMQKPAPALVLNPDLSQAGLIEPRQRIVLPVLLMGPAIPALRAFTKVLERLGQQGIYKGNGHYFVEAIETEDASGVRSMLWVHGDAEAEVSPPVSDLAWWLERQQSLAQNCRINVLTPMRLIHQGRPLFKADFSELFPFILRRVSALLAHYGQVELVHDARHFQALAQQIVTDENHLRWKDWRRLRNHQGGQNLGGLVGSLDLSGGALNDLSWVLHLGSLFNIGKGAAFGAGQYVLTVPE